jgi:hypothetical protein
MNTLLAGVAAKPGVTRVGAEWILQQCKKDVKDNARWGVEYQRPA